MSIDFAPLGRQGIGLVQPQSGTDFPLVGIPSPDIRYLLADAWLSYDDPADYTPELVEYVPPFRIAWLHGVGVTPNSAPAGYPTPTHDVDILVVDANNCIVFDSTLADEFYTEEWTDRLTIYGWEAADAVMFIVVHTKWAETADPNIVPTEYDEHIVPARAVLDARTGERRPKRVKSFTVVLDNFTRTPVEFVEGFNMDIVPEGRFLRGNGLRSTQRLVFHATPGAGLGIFPGCEPQALFLRRINSVSPTATGEFFTAATNCYYIRQPSTIISTSPRVASLTPAMLQLGNDCSPCCGCDDYVAVAEYMNRTRDRYKDVGRDLESTRNLYHTSRDRFLASKRCFEQFPLRLAVQPQRCPFVDVGAQFCNLSDECVGPLLMQICVELVGSDGSLSSATLDPECLDVISEEVPGFTHIRGQTYGAPRRSSAIERYKIGGLHPCYMAYWDIVEASQSVWVRFRLRFGCCGVDVNGSPLFVRLTLTAEIGEPLNGPLVSLTIPVFDQDGNSLSETQALASDEVLLRCPADPNDTFDVVTGEACA